MKRTKITLLSVYVLFSVTAYAQSSTGFFVEQSVTRHHLNPAFSPDQGYIGIPLLSNFHLTAGSNLDAGSLLFNKNGTTYTFMNSSVSADDFLSGISSQNFLNGFVNMDLIDFGFRCRENFFWTVNIGIHTELESSLPYSLFSFIKKGMADKTCTRYDISDVNLRADSYAQASVGFTADIASVEGLSIGFKVKALMGLERAAMKIDRMTVELSENQYSVSTYASGYLAGRSIRLTEDEEGKVSGAEFDRDNLNYSGLGFGADLGISYRISNGSALDGLGFSISAVDLGIINYKSDDVKELYTNEGTLTYSGTEFTSFKTADFSGTFEQLGDDFRELVSVRQKNASSDMRKKLSTKLYAAVDYSFCRDKMKVGVLYYIRFGEYSRQQELTLGWNYSPARAFNIALSCSFLNSRQSFGWLLSFTPKAGLNLFLGSDYTPIQYAAHGIPLKSGLLDLNFGVSVPIQRKYAR